MMQNGNMAQNRKLTKIITTLGPAVETKEAAKKLLAQGSNVCRFNFSHGSHEEQGRKMDMIREVAKEEGVSWSILLDSKGPEIRTHLFEGGEVAIEKDAVITVHCEEILGNSTEFSVSYPELYKDVKVGGTILVDDGYLELEITNIENNKIITVAKNSHTVADRRGINVPGVVLNIPFMSEKDRADYIFGCEKNVDYMALSFVQRASDVAQVREILKQNNKEHIQLIAKLENQAACDNFDEILEAVDGIMVARGDLGVEIHAWDVPGYQKDWVRKANAAGKLAIVATQMLESMIKNPRPTRAEVSDVYNAIEDAATTVMLSGESAKGPYGPEAVHYMSETALASEMYFDYESYRNNLLKMSKGKYDEIATDIAFKADADLNHIILFDKDIDLAKDIARFRPRCKIILVTDKSSVATAFGASYAIFTELVDNVANYLHDENKIQEVAKKFGAKIAEEILVVEPNVIKGVHIK